MLDIRLIRSDPERVRAGLARRGDDLSPLDEVIDLDVAARELAQRRDEARHRIKELSEQVGDLHRDGKGDEAAALQEESKVLGAEEKALASQAAEGQARIRDLLLRISNIPSDDTPDGETEADNPVLRSGGPDLDRFGDAQRVPHWDIGEALGVLDVERAVKVSGSMFVLYRGLGATLARALCQFALDHNADAYEEIRPPSLVLTDTLTATGQLPKFADDAYHVERDDLWAIPTAEVPLTSIARDEVVAEADLPVRMMACTPCYRREAGSAGRDTRGLLRVHEFDKVELLAYTTPAQGPELQQEVLQRAEQLIADLGLSYRIVDICAGDLGQSHHRSWDIEVYAPGVDQWLEVSSVSWFGDYQARRAGIRYRPDVGKGTDFVHTVNGSGLAVPRVWAALVETHRREDGTVAVPEPLHPYMRGATELRPPA